MLTVNMTIRIERPSEAVAEIWLDGALGRSVPFRIVEAAR